MDKKNKRSSSARDDGDKRKKYKKSDVETDHPSSSKSLKSGKGVLKPCSESKVDLKKRKKHREISEEIKEIKKSIKEQAKAIKILQETLLTKPDVLEVVPVKEEEDGDMDKCGFDCEDAEGNNGRTIFVKGFQHLRTRNEIKNLLTSAFASCGEMSRVFVPIECQTRVPLGFAFINFENGYQGIEKALKFNGYFLQGRKLEVTMATTREEYAGLTNFRGCKRCIPRLHGINTQCLSSLHQPGSTDYTSSDVSPYSHFFFEESD